MLRIYETSLRLIRMLRPVVDTIARALRSGPCSADAKAMTSITLNIAEGSYARGRNRQAQYQIALGSAKETKACLDVALSFGYIESTRQVFADLRSIRQRSTASSRREAIRGM